MFFLKLVFVQCNTIFQGMDCPCAKDCYMDGVRLNVPNMNGDTIEAEDRAGCYLQCKNNAACVAFTYNKQSSYCGLKATLREIIERQVDEPRNRVSGSMSCFASKS